MILGFALLCLFSSLSNGQLYATDGGQPTPGPSTLYSVGANGAASTIGATGFSHLSAIAYNPIDMMLYGIDNTGPGAAILLTLNPSSGAVSIIGPLPQYATAVDYPVPDITFDSTGRLVGVVGTGLGVGDIIDIATDASSVALIGNPVGAASRPGLSFDAAGDLWLKNDNEMCRVNPATGALIGVCTALSGSGSATPGFFGPALTWDFSTSQFVTICDVKSRACDVAPGTFISTPRTSSFGIGAPGVATMVGMAWFLTPVVME